ncbi:MAG TPA: VOC family protein [Sphingomonas sp.]|nr:VOC family protein [Sphingomonas sp.]
MSVRSLAYILVESTDLDAWRRFGCDVMGLQLVDGPEGALSFRMDDRPFRIRIRSGERDRFAGAGLEIPSREAFEATVEGLRRAGMAVEQGAAEQAAERHVEAYVSCADPAGNPLELCWGNTVAGTPFVSPVGVPGFVTGEMGMGHVVLPTDRYDETRAFYKDLLGFGDSDSMRVHFPGGPPTGLGMSFMHASGPRHHTVAVGEFPAPSGMIHAMVEVPSIDDVGLALDRALAAGVHISSTLGRHTNDKMLSFYMRSPSGFDIEYGCGGARYHDWSVVTPTITIKEDLWGHKWDFGQ